MAVVDDVVDDVVTVVGKASDLCICGFGLSLRDRSGQVWYKHFRCNLQEPNQAACV